VTTELRKLIIVKDKLRQVIDLHTAHNIRARSGQWIDDYVDLREALLCSQCQFAVYGFYKLKVQEHSPILESPIYLFGTGTFGAALLPFFAQTPHVRPILWNPKEHGRIWSGAHATASAGELRAILVDDVKTTGVTLRSLRDAVEQFGYEIIAEVVAIDRTRQPIAD
jgi:orotate phosphoribosyltransferase